MHSESLGAALNRQLSLIKDGRLFRPGFYERMPDLSISVVLAVWNGERYLAEAIESVLKQDAGGMEVIVVDDGSTDGTPGILSKLESDARIRVLRQSNQGLVAALNAGIQLSRGEYIARIDADDVCMPGRLSAQRSFLERHPEVLAVGGAIELIDEYGRPKGRRNYPVGQVAATRGMLKGCTLAHPAVMMRRKAVLEAGGYRACFKHAEDYDLWLRLIERGRVDNLDDIVIKYRVHADSVTKKHASLQSISAAAALIACQRRMRGLPDPFDNRETPITIGELVGGEFSGEEQAAFAYVRFKQLAEAMAGTDEYLVALRWAWSLRRHIPRGRLVRHCLAPAISVLRKSGRIGEAFGWFARAFMTEPLSACWMLLR